MSKEQNTNDKKLRKVSLSIRLIAGGFFLVLTTGFALLWASESGFVDLAYWFGDCGFRQRFDLPCPGCGWTHAAQAFVTGHVLSAFMIQPAAAFFCVVLSLAAVFALHLAVFGINFRLLKRILSPKNAVVLLVSACVVALAGWLVNLIRTALENG